MEWKCFCLLRGPASLNTVEFPPRCVSKSCPRTAESEFPWPLTQKAGVVEPGLETAGHPKKGPVLQWVVGLGSEAELSRGEESAGQREPGEGGACASDLGEEGR